MSNQFLCVIMTYMSHKDKIPLSAPSINTTDLIITCPPVICLAFFSVASRVVNCSAAQHVIVLWEVLQYTDISDQTNSNFVR